MDGETWVRFHDLPANHATVAPLLIIITSFVLYIISLVCYQLCYAELFLNVFHETYPLSWTAMKQSISYVLKCELNYTFKISFFFFIRGWCEGAK